MITALTTRHWERTMKGATHSRSVHVQKDTYITCDELYFFLLFNVIFNFLLFGYLRLYVCMWKGRKPRGGNDGHMSVKACGCSGLLVRGGASVKAAQCEGP